MNSAYHTAVDADEYMHLANHGYFDHKKKRKPEYPNWSPILVKNGVDMRNLSSISVDDTQHASSYLYLGARQSKHDITRCFITYGRESQVWNE